ncbi:MAG: hypothetical protein NT098_03110 [Candidatus Parcubacteria bacterium]|nr:hypothetical protein [Candidatus Parcubacteria bacterium]
MADKYSPYITIPYGRVHTAIDFSNQIHNFKGHQTDGHYIYYSPEYTIFSHHDPIKENFFEARAIVVSTENYDSILLEDCAREWIISPERNIDIFDSKDFLEQTCITHTIWRIRTRHESLDPWNDYQREMADEDKKIEDNFLRIFDPKIKEVSNVFFKKYPCMEREEIYAQTYLFCQLIIAGENEKVIKEINDFKNKNGKQQARQCNKGLKLHPLRTFANSKNFDIEKTTSESIEEILRLIPNAQYGGKLSLCSLLLPENLSGVVSGTINYNSKKVYKPWYDQNIRDYIFGKKGEKHSIIFSLLKDYFKTEIRHRNIHNNFDDTRSQEEVLVIKRRWKRNKPTLESESEKERILKIAQSILPKKQLVVYIKWLQGAYNSGNQNERQNLKKAKDKIKQTKANIPI